MFYHSGPRNEPELVCLAVEAFLFAWLILIIFCIYLCTWGVLTCCMGNGLTLWITYQNYSFHIATHIPQNILQTVLKLMGDKWMELDTTKLAPSLHQADMITYDEHYRLSNALLNPTERVNELTIRILQSKGKDQPNLLVLFYTCLLAAKYSHLAREIRQRGRLLAKL